MRKHVIQFEVSVPDKMTEAELLAKMQAVLDLLEHKTGNVKLDPPPQKEFIPVPSPRDDQAIPLPYKPYKPYSPKPYRPSIGDPVNPQWQRGDEYYRHYEAYKQKLDQKRNEPIFKDMLAKINGLTES